MKKLNMNKFLYTVMSLVIFSVSAAAAELKTPEMLPAMPENPLSEEIVIKKYDYSNTTRVPIYLHIENKYKTDNNTKTGDKLTFVVSNDVYYKNKLLIRHGEKTNATIAYFIHRGMNGIPSILILDGFQFKNIDSRKLEAKYIKRGFDNTLFVLPLKWALTFLYPLGSFTNFIIGCEANISPKDEILIYYYPERILE